MDDSIVGSEIDGYHVEEVLGRGGMGTVYKAEDTSLARSVALKCLNPELAGDEAFLRRFRSEARAIARIDSPYIVQIHALTQTEIGLVIVMEYVEGGTLKQRIRAGSAEWEQAIPVIQQMLTALQHAHGAGVIHRDVKPHNILLSDIVLAHGHRVKMTDFGLAKINRSGDPNRTVTEGVYGTLYYMSPEQVEGHGQIDHRSDLYSLAMTSYEMLAGRLPFDRDSGEYAIMNTIVEGEVLPLAGFAPEVPGQLQEVIMTALATDPADRFQSAEEMKEALEDVESVPEFTGSDPDVASIPDDFGSAGDDGDLQGRGPGRMIPNAWQALGGLLLGLVVVAAGFYYLVPGALSPSGTAGESGAEPQEEVASSAQASAAGAAPAPGTPPDSVQSPPDDSAGQESAGQESAGQGAEQNPADAGREDPERSSSPSRSTEDTNRASAGSPSVEPSDQAASDSGTEQEQAPSSDRTGKRTDEAATPPRTEPQEPSRAVAPDPPSLIKKLAQIRDVGTLQSRLDSLQGRGDVRAGTRVSRPGEYYAFVEVLAGANYGTVDAVYGPRRGGQRVDLRSGTTVDVSGDTGLTGTYDPSRYQIRYVYPVQR